MECTLRLQNLVFLSFIHFFYLSALLLLENYTLVFRGQRRDGTVFPIQLPCKHIYVLSCFSLSLFPLLLLESCALLLLENYTLVFRNSVEFELCSLYSFPVNTSTFSCVSLSLFPLLLFESCALLLLENYTLVFRGQLGDKPVLPIRLPCKHIYDLLCSSLSLFPLLIFESCALLLLEHYTLCV